MQILKAFVLRFYILNKQKNDDIKTSVNICKRLHNHKIKHNECSKQCNDAKRKL
jgi:hypothetical protein